MEVSKVGLIGSWLQTNGCLIGLTIVSIPYQGTFLIIVQSFYELRCWTGALNLLGWLTGGFIKRAIIEQ